MTTLHARIPAYVESVPPGVIRICLLYTSDAADE